MNILEFIKIKILYGKMTNCARYVIKVTHKKQNLKNGLCVSKYWNKNN